MAVRLGDDNDSMLTNEAGHIRRDEQGIAKQAIHRHLTANQEVFEAILARTMERHAELLKRLA